MGLEDEYVNQSNVNFCRSTIDYQKTSTLQRLDLQFCIYT